MRQTWCDLLFAHWPIGRTEIRELVPSALELDTFDGQPWIAVTPFTLDNVAPRLVPSVPWVSRFAEINVRTYVMVDDRPGVFFFSLDASSSIAVAAARLLFNLPYFAADIVVDPADDGWHYVATRSVNPPARFEARYRPAGAPFQATHGSLEHWMTERYCPIQSMRSMAFTGPTFIIARGHSSRPTRRFPSTAWRPPPASACPQSRPICSLPSASTSWSGRPSASHAEM
jgi:uncharacterized protein YqjF (DUF2071 family)